MSNTINKKRQPAVESKNATFRLLLPRRHTGMLRRSPPAAIALGNCRISTHESCFCLGWNMFTSGVILFHFLPYSLFLCFEMRPLPRIRTAGRRYLLLPLSGVYFFHRRPT